MTYRLNRPDFIAETKTATGVTITAKAWGKGDESIWSVRIADELYDSGAINRAAKQADVAYEARFVKQYLDSLSKADVEQLIADVMIQPTIGRALLTAMER
jgi:hypothetical protein